VCPPQPRRGADPRTSVSTTHVRQLLAFKVGTALRKLYAGAQGRFSVDLDFSVRDIGVDDATTLALLTGTVTRLTLGPFPYGLSERRGKKALTIDTPLGRPVS